MQIKKKDEQVKKGKAPKGVDRVDPADPRNGVDESHIHFGNNDAALTQSGKWHDAGKNIPQLTNAQKEWITGNGWRLPE